MLKLTIIAMGSKMPSWIVEGTEEYSKRLREAHQLKIIEIPLTKRSKSSDLNRIIENEASGMIAALPPNAKIIALDIEGKTFSSAQLAQELNHCQQEFSHICFLIGGPEGLSEKILQRCHDKWSLSKLTLPHPLARLILLEALYRAWAINHNHPYHK